jgi:hypothetical protein
VGHKKLSKNVISQTPWIRKTRQYSVKAILSQMKNYLLKVENMLIIPKSYISRGFDTISR